MDLGLRGRTAIVCGASSGLGLGSAEALAEEGANVAMLARRREQLEQDAERIGALAAPAATPRARGGTGGRGGGAGPPPPPPAATSPTRPTSSASSRRRCRP